MKNTSRADNKSLLNEFFELVKAGDSKKAEAFLIENFNSFPEDLKKEIVFSFLSDAVGSYIEEEQKEFEFENNALGGLADALEETGKGE